MIDREVESIFDYSDGRENSNIPDAIYGGSGVEYCADFSKTHLAMAKEYLECWMDQFQQETCLKIDYKYESYSSPREYNFETDRLFAWVKNSSIKELFAASKADNHAQLAEMIKERFTSRSGFISSYSNDLESWLDKPLLQWDHNELGTLLKAVLAIHYDEDRFDTYELMESFECNGGLSNAVWDAIPAKVGEFADLQREHKKPIDFDLWIETGEAYPEGTDREDLVNAGAVPPLPCPYTLDLFKGGDCHA
jgi:hypothetical protein